MRRRVASTQRGDAPAQHFVARARNHFASTQRDDALAPLVVALAHRPVALAQRDVALAQRGAAPAQCVGAALAAGCSAREIGAANFAAEAALTKPRSQGLSDRRQ